MTSPADLHLPPPGPHLRGALVLARFEYLRREHGPAMVERVMDSLEERDRRALTGVDPGQWYPFRTVGRLDRAIARLVSPDDDTIYERLGAASARHRTEWIGADARLYSVHGFLSRVAEQHHLFHSFGEAVYRRDGFTEGAIAFSRYPELDATFCRANLGYLRGAVEFLTSTPATVQERSCQCHGDPACHYGISWTP
jgi:uncharacterized protein (TIGR02265 family)